MTPAGRHLQLAAFLGLVIAVGCGIERPSSPLTTGAACSVEPSEPAERVVLVSEALATRAAGRKDVADFGLSARGPLAVHLQLQAVGCSCYQVLHDGRSLRVGDQIAIPAKGAIRLQIAAEPATEPGVREYRADLVGSHGDGTPFTLSLSQSIRTLADIVVRPDVVQIDLDDASLSLTDGVPVQIEQIVRTPDPGDVTATWDGIPGGITATSPVLAEPETRIGAGLWRVRRQSTIRMHRDGHSDLDPERPVPLSVVTSRNGVEMARSGCVLMARRRSGIVAPPLVHLGRVVPGTPVSRRVQLRAVDSLPFIVLSAASRDGTVEPVVVDATPAAEHWIEIRASGGSAVIRDELTIETDHLVTPRLRLPVRSLGESGASVLDQ